LHWSWQVWSVPNPIWEHGVSPMHFVTQSEVVEQSTPSLVHVKPPLHDATYAQT